MCWGLRSRWRAGGPDGEHAIHQALCRERSPMRGARWHTAHHRTASSSLPQSGAQGGEDVTGRFELHQGGGGDLSHSEMRLERLYQAPTSLAHPTATFWSSPEKWWGKNVAVYSTE